MSRCTAPAGFPGLYSAGGGCVSLTSLVLLSVSSSDSSKEAPSMCSWRRPDRLDEKLMGPPRLGRRESRRAGVKPGTRGAPAVQPPEASPSHPFRRARPGARGWARSGEALCFVPLSSSPAWPAPGGPRASQRAVATGTGRELDGGAAGP